MDFALFSKCDRNKTIFTLDCFVSGSHDEGKVGELALLKPSWSAAVFNDYTGSIRTLFFFFSVSLAGSMRTPVSLGHRELEFTQKNQTVQR